MSSPVATPDATEQVDTTQDPTANTAPEVQPNPGQGTGPWANDLATLFEDEGVRNQVDEFLRTKVQPHVTQLEQSRRELEDAGQLYSALQESPAETYLALTEDIFGTETAQAIRDQLVSLYSEEDEDDELDYDDVDDTNLPPEVRELLDERRQTKEAEAYNAELNRVVEQYKDTDAPVVADLFHPFVAAAEGDFDTAYQGYSRWYEQAKAQFGVQPEPEPVEEPPSVIGSDSTGTSTPPTEKKYTSIDEALTDTLAEMRANRPAPTVVGSA